MLKLAELLLLCQCSVADGLMYFKGLIDMESFQSNLEKMEKLCNSNSCEGELDFKSIFFIIISLSMKISNLFFTLTEFLTSYLPLLI